MTDNVLKLFSFVNRRCVEKRALLKQVVKIILIGLIYVILISQAGFSIPCPFRRFTGFLCPGCGVTTLFLSLAHNDLKSAQQANAFLFYTLPFLLLSVTIEFIMPKSKVSRLNHNFFMPLYLLALIAFGFYRNMSY